jgi:hypothetical protein
MVVLFDNGTPRTPARYLIDRHTVTEARVRGWEQLDNGALLTAAEAAGFERRLIIERSRRGMRYQKQPATQTNLPTG